METNKEGHKLINRELSRSIQQSAYRQMCDTISLTETLLEDNNENILISWDINYF